MTGALSLNDIRRQVVIPDEVFVNVLVNSLLLSAPAARKLSCYFSITSDSLSMRSFEFLSMLSGTLLLAASWGKHFGVTRSKI